MTAKYSLTVSNYVVFDMVSAASRWRSGTRNGLSGASSAELQRSASDPMHETGSGRSLLGNDATFKVMLILHRSTNLYGDTLDHSVVDCWRHQMPLVLSRSLKAAPVRLLEDRKTWCHS